MHSVFLKPGEVFVSDQPTRVSTVLGSCVSIFVFDQKLRIGGANHFMLPKPESGIEKMSERFAYGCFAIPELFRQLKQRGSQKEDLIVKIVGGASVLESTSGSAGKEVGRVNVECAHEYLRKLGISVAKESTGGRFGFKVEFLSEDGIVRMKKVSEAVLSDPVKAPIRVMIIDDSRAIRLALRRLIEENREFVVIAEANDPIEAMEIRKTVKPDVITLDINMPLMDGITYLRQYMQSDPVPTILITAYSLEDSGPVFTGLENGAFDYLEKPSLSEMASYGARVREMVTAAARSRHRVRSKVNSTAKVLISASDDQLAHSIIAIGASTGGTEAIKEVLMKLPPNIPPIVIVQHIPPVFSKAFADRLNTVCVFSVKEASDGDRLEPGNAYVAPGGRHMRIKKSGGSFRIELTDDEPVNRFRPSVDYLFDSIAAAKKQGGPLHVTGVLLTGMGADGAKGLLGLRESGSHTMAQDEKTSVVFGMPRAAIELGAATFVTPLDDIAQTIAQCVNRPLGTNAKSRKIG